LLLLLLACLLLLLACYGKPSFNLISEGIREKLPHLLFIYYFWKVILVYHFWNIFWEEWLVYGGIALTSYNLKQAQWNSSLSDWKWATICDCNICDCNLVYLTNGGVFWHIYCNICHTFFVCRSSEVLFQVIISLLNVIFVVSEGGFTIV
jgi:hypothetical protein